MAQPLCARTKSSHCTAACFLDRGGGNWHVLHVHPTIWTSTENCCSCVRLAASSVDQLHDCFDAVLWRFFLILPVGQHRPPRRSLCQFTPAQPVRFVDQYWPDVAGLAGGLQANCGVLVDRFGDAARRGQCSLVVANRVASTADVDGVNRCVGWAQAAIHPQSAVGRRAGLCKRIHSVTPADRPGTRRQWYFGAYQRRRGGLLQPADPLAQRA